MVNRVAKDIEEGTGFGGAFSGSIFPFRAPTSASLAQFDASAVEDASAPRTLQIQRAGHLQNIDDVESEIYQKSPRPSKRALVQYEKLRREKKKPSRLMVTGKEIHPFNTWFLTRFMTPMGKIMPRRLTGLSVRKQKKLARAIKTARQFGLIPTVGRYDPRLYADLETAQPDTPLIPIDGKFDRTASDRNVHFSHPRNVLVSPVKEIPADKRGKPNWEAKWGVDDGKTFSMQYDPFRAFSSHEIEDEAAEIAASQEASKALDSQRQWLEGIRERIAGGEEDSADVDSGEFGISASELASIRDLTGMEAQDGEAAASVPSALTDAIQGALGASKENVDTELKRLNKKLLTEYFDAEEDSASDDDVVMLYLLNRQMSK